MLERCKEQYKRWLTCVKDETLHNELVKISDNDEQIIDAFYRELEFGTGGLRGVIGAGTNRMNIYTVAKATQGLANYICRHFEEGKRKIAISYDSRINSTLFARVSAQVCAANNIEVHLYKELMPTPCLSFAVRELQCAAGIMVTASHNPAKYNGYKVYGPDGCQITTTAADIILNEINHVDPFDDALMIDFDEAICEGKIKYIDDELYTKFIECVKAESVLFGEQINKDVKIIYSPLNGTGLKPVTRALKESGFTNVTVVKEQEHPDGNFPTCPYPNPEIKEAMQLGINYAKQYNADLLLATDPDCDRVGIAVKDHQGEFVLLTGNETGLLLVDYMCSQLVKNNKMPDDGIMVKTIVTTDLAERIASKYGVKTINVLTGFKFIGEQIALLESKNREVAYIIGFEESYGYLTGTYVRDKDAVNASLLICEMFAYYATQNISLLDKLNALYKEFGYALNTLHSYTFEGSTGFAKMQDIMVKFRQNVTTIGPCKVAKCLDYNEGIDNLPKADVIKFYLETNASVVVRPSGTEPKLKTYISVSAEDEVQAKALEKQLNDALNEFILGNN